MSWWNPLNLLGIIPPGPPIPTPAPTPVPGIILPPGYELIEGCVNCGCGEPPNYPCDTCPTRPTRARLNIINAPQGWPCAGGLIGVQALSEPFDQQTRTYPFADIFGTRGTSITGLGLQCCNQLGQFCHERGWMWTLGVARIYTLIGSEPCELYDHVSLGNCSTFQCDNQYLIQYRCNPWLVVIYDVDSILHYIFTSGD